MIWSPFVLYSMRKTELLKTDKEGIKNLIKTSKDLALDMKDRKEFNEDEMKQ